LIGVEGINPSAHGVYEGLLGVLAVALILSGVDDLVPVLLCLWHRFRRPAEKKETKARARKTERRIAIFVPCWREAEVIGDMVRHNIAAIKYQKYEFFLGVYPNDEATVEITRDLASKIKNVHVAMCPNDGPTSKADCLNSLYQRMLAYEKQRRVRFDTVVIHDAEDLIHPDALSLINRERSHYEMVQVPVLPLPTPPSEFTHGIYCEDFAEYQMLDMRARQISKSFIPSNGVGTGYSRKILTRLASENNNVLFDAGSLTEDYESGLRIHALGFSQTFCRLRHAGADYLATREYFPRRFDAAVRQRTRWVMGNCLQSWERHGWRGSPAVKYWLWRDRKGLLTSPISFVTNVFFIAGLATWCWSSIVHEPWIFEITSPVVGLLCGITLALQCFRLAVRMECVRRIFGLGFALLVPMRAVHGNLINALAAVQATCRYVNARRKGRALAWLKTDHAYPDQQSRSHRHRDFEEVLVGSGFLTKPRLDILQSRVPEGAELPDYLLHAHELSEEGLSEVLGLQQGVPSAYLDPAEINPLVARVLPGESISGSPVIPFRVDRGRLLVAGPRTPKAGELKAFERYTRLEIEFHLVTWRNFEELLRLVV
jgi:bacteriophage N4 adsorption protein B